LLRALCSFASEPHTNICFLMIFLGTLPTSPLAASTNRVVEWEVHRILWDRLHLVAKNGNCDSHGNRRISRHTFEPMRQLSQMRKNKIKNKIGANSNGCLFSRKSPSFVKAYTTTLRVSETFYSCKPQ